MALDEVLFAQRTLLRRLLYFSAVNEGVALFLYARFPGMRWHLVKEGYFVQNATAVFFFSGFIVAAWFLAASPHPPIRRRYRWIALASLMGGLDEVRYGTLLFHPRLPVLLGKKIDALHDLLNVAFIYFRHYPLGHLVETLSAIALAGLVIRFRLLARMVALCRTDPPYLFFFIAVAFGIVSESIDVKIVGGQYKHVVEEVSEMNGSIALFLAAILIGKETARRSRASARQPIPWAAEDPLTSLAARSSISSLTEPGAEEN